MTQPQEDDDWDCIAGPPPTPGEFKFIVFLCAVIGIAYALYWVGAI